MNKAKIKSWLEVVTNIAVLIAAVALIVVLARGYLGSGRGDDSQGSLPKGSRFHVQNVDYGAASRTLILVLNTRCGFCTRSLPFYRQLVEAQGGGETGVQIIAVFSDTEEDANRYLQQHLLPIKSVSGADFGALKVDATPTLVAVDNKGTVLNSWVGRLSKERERDVFRTMGLQVPVRAGSGNSTAQVKRSIDIFDEHASLVSIQPDIRAEQEVLKFINLFDVDAGGNVYLMAGDSFIKYDAGGRLVEKVAQPPFEGNFCVDAEGNSYFPGEGGISIFSPSLTFVRKITLPNFLADGSTALKLAFDRARNHLYVQVYRGNPLGQILYRIDPRTSELKPVFELENPVRFSPTYAPGAFDFAVGKNYLYVSDIREYKVHLFSLQDGALLRTFSKPFDPRPIREEDGKLTLRKMTVGGLTASGLEDYPPILHLNYSSGGHVLVWTSQRDAESRQLVDVYDGEMNFIGTDFKYAHPGRSNYVFANGKVVVPDFGFGQRPEDLSLSPLEIPGKPFGLKIFDESFSAVKNTKGNS